MGIRSAVLPLAFALTATTAGGCSRPEGPILRQFFSASSLRDNTALDNFALVRFDPRTDGTVTTFRIDSVSPGRTRPLDVKSLAADTALVRLSVDDPRNPAEAAGSDGELVSRQVTIAAQVRRPSGQTAHEVLTITMERAILKGGAGKKIVGRWVITWIEGAGRAPRQHSHQGRWSVSTASTRAISQSPDCFSRRTVASRASSVASPVRASRPDTFAVRWTCALA